MRENTIKREVLMEQERIRRTEEVVPFFGLLLTVNEAAFRPLPAEILAIIQSSQDYISIRPGEHSTWVQLETDNDDAALVLYRAGDGSYHVLAPTIK